MSLSYNTCIDTQSLKKSANNMESRMNSLIPSYGREGTLLIEELKDKLNNLAIENDDCFAECLPSLSSLNTNTKEITLKINSLSKKMQNVCEIYSKAENNLENDDTRSSLLSAIDQELGLKGLDSLTFKDYEIVLTNNKETLKNDMSTISHINLALQLEKETKSKVVPQATTTINGIENMSTNSYLTSTVVSGITSGMLGTSKILLTDTNLSNTNQEDKKIKSSNNKTSDQESSRKVKGSTAQIINMRANATSITSADLEKIAPITLGVTAGGTTAIGGTKYVKNKIKKQLKETAIDENYRVEETDLLKETETTDKDKKPEEYLNDDYDDYMDYIEEDSTTLQPSIEKEEPVTSKKGLKYKPGKINQLRLEDDKI